MQKFKNLKVLQQYTIKHGRFQEGEIVQTSDDEKLYIYKNGEWEEITAKIAESNIQMKLYDLNKQIMSQMEPYTMEQWEKAAKAITAWDKENAATYYMLLCRDISYYTVFVNDGYELHNFGDAVRECFEFIGGDVVDIDIDPGVIEIWVKNEETTYCFYLFNYETGVVSFKR